MSLLRGLILWPDIMAFCSKIFGVSRQVKGTRADAWSQCRPCKLDDVMFWILRLSRELRQAGSRPLYKAASCCQPVAVSSHRCCSASITAYVCFRTIICVIGFACWQQWGFCLVRLAGKHCWDIDYTLRTLCLLHVAIICDNAGASSAARSTGGPFGRSLQQVSALCGTQGYIVGESYCVTIRKLLVKLVAHPSSDTVACMFLLL